MKLFKNNNSTTKDLQIEYLEEESTDYEVLIPWKNDFTGTNFFEWLNTRFSDFRDNDIQNDNNVYFFKNESTVAFRINADILNLSPSILWNYWKDEIKDIGYSLQNSEIEYRGNKSTCRYYLKPRLKYKVEGNQLFGNITLELIKNGAKPEYIMLKCTWYQDQHYKNVRDFEELFSALTR